MEGVMVLELTANDWRKEIVEYLKDSSKKVNRKVRFQAIKYVLLEFCSNASIKKKLRY